MFVINWLSTIKLQNNSEITNFLGHFFIPNWRKEVAQTHKPLFGGEHFLTGKEVCERLYISPRTLQDYRDRKIIPYTQFAGKILYKASDLERLLEDCYRV